MTGLTWRSSSPVSARYRAQNRLRPLAVEEIGRRRLGDGLEVAHVLAGVADGGELPVEHHELPVVRQQQVGALEVAVHEGQRRRRRPVGVEPRGDVAQHRDLLGAVVGRLPPLVDARAEVVVPRGRSGEGRRGGRPAGWCGSWRGSRRAAPPTRRQSRRRPTWVRNGRGLGVLEHDRRRTELLTGRVEVVGPAVRTPRSSITRRTLHSTARSVWIRLRSGGGSPRSTKVRRRRSPSTVHSISARASRRL